MHLPAGSRLQLPRPGLYAKPHSQPIFKNNLSLTNTSGLLLLPRSTISSTWRGTSTEREATQSPLLLFPFPRCHQERTTKPGSSNQNHWSSPGKKPLAPEPWDPLLRLGVLAGIEQALTPSYSDPSPAHIGLIRGQTPRTAGLSPSRQFQTIPAGAFRSIGNHTGREHWQSHWQALASNNTDIVSDKH